MTDAAENPLGREPVGRLFVRLALPAVTAQVINVLYNLVDRMYIGHIPDIGGTALTGVGVTSPVLLLLSAFAALVSMGGAPRASIALGRGDRQEAEQSLGSCAFTLTVLSLVLAACVTGSACIWAACMFAPRAVAHIFTNSPELVDYTVWALRIFMSMSLIFGVQIACQYSLVALDDAPTAIAMTIYRKLLLLIPLIFLLPRFVPDPAMGVLLAEPVSDTLAVCTTSTVFFFRFRKQMREIS